MAHSNNTPQASDNIPPIFARIIGFVFGSFIGSLIAILFLLVSQVVSIVSTGQLSWDLLKIGTLFPTAALTSVITGSVSSYYAKSWVPILIKAMMDKEPAPKVSRAVAPSSASHAPSAVRTQSAKPTAAPRLQLTVSCDHPLDGTTAATRHSSVNKNQI